MKHWYMQSFCICLFNFNDKCLNSPISISTRNALELGLCYGHFNMHRWEGVWPFWVDHFTIIAKLTSATKKKSLTCNFELHSHWTFILHIYSPYPYIGQCGGTYESWKTLPCFRIMTKCQTFGLQDHLCTIISQFSIIIIYIYVL